MAAADLAELPLAHRRLLIHAELLGAARHLHGLGLPQRERIDRPGRPRAARAAMTVAHAGRFAADFERNRAAEAFAFMCRHDSYLAVLPSPSPRQRVINLNPSVFFGQLIDLFHLVR